MVFNASLAARIRGSPAWRRNIEEKRMFGGTVFLLDGNVLVVWRENVNRDYMPGKESRKRQL